MGKGNKKIITNNDRVLVNATPNELALLRAAKERADGIKTKSDGIIMPEDVRIRDDVFKPEGELDGPEKGENPEVEGGIITEDFLKKEEEARKAEAERYTQEFFRQFQEWASIDDWSEYDWCSFNNSDYLVRIFKMNLSGFDNYKTLEYVWSPILKNWKLQDLPLQEGLFPIGKILSIGKGVKEEDRYYKVGDIVLLPSHDIVGEDWNPSFIQVMQFQDSKGMTPKLPKGMKQMIPNVEKHWGKYKFIRPWVPKAEEKDNLTYLVGSPFIKGSYNWRDV